jgi:hypothetical protein
MLIVSFYLRSLATCHLLSQDPKPLFIRFRRYGCRMHARIYNYLFNMLKSCMLDKKTTFVTTVDNKCHNMLVITTTNINMPE